MKFLSNDALNNFGYTLIKNVISDDLLTSMRCELEKQAAYELENNDIFVKQDDQIILKNVFLKIPLFLPLLDLEPIMDLCKINFIDGFTLQSMNASCSIPIGDKHHEFRPHIDSRLPVKGNEHTLGIGVAFCIDDFNEKNGATRVWPFSHLTGLRPEALLDLGLTLPDPNIVEAKAGDAIVFLAHLWHAVGPNRSNKSRWGIFAFFNPWWVRPTWDYRDCGEDMFKMLSNNQKQLFGFNTQTPLMNSSRNLTKTKIEDLPLDYESAKNIV
jgi:ectoine hydroxylase-related dioxygenase (phytanoyl-CoA dioxygenase family)